MRIKLSLILRRVSLIPSRFDENPTSQYKLLQPRFHNSPFDVRFKVIRFGEKSRRCYFVVDRYEFGRGTKGPRWSVDS
jgi:hypothetical protein